MGIIMKETGPCGVVVLARGAVSRKWYVAYNGRVLTRTVDVDRAGALYSDFTTLAHTGDKYPVNPYGFNLLS